MAIFNSYVSLPEGMMYAHTITMIWVLLYVLKSVLVVLAIDVCLVLPFAMQSLGGWNEYSQIMIIGYGQKFSTWFCWGVHDCCNNDDIDNDDNMTIIIVTITHRIHVCHIW